MSESARPLPITKERMHRILCIFYYGVAALVFAAIASEMISRPLYDKTTESGSLWVWEHGLLEKGVWQLYAMELGAVIIFVAFVYFSYKRKIFWLLLAPYAASCFLIYQLFHESYGFAAWIALVVITVYMVVCGAMYLKTKKE